MEISKGGFALAIVEPRLWNSSIHYLLVIQAFFKPIVPWELRNRWTSCIEVIVSGGVY